MAGLSAIQFEVLSAVAALGKPHIYRVMQNVSSRTSSVYAAVSALQARGVLRAEWEQDAPTGRPQRKLAELTPLGQQVLQGEIAARAGASVQQRSQKSSATQS